MDDRRCPHVIDVTGSDVHGEAAYLRSRGPAVQVELPGGVVAWSINDYEAAKSVFVDSRAAKDPRRHWPAFVDGEIGDDWPLISWVKMDSMAIADGADHRRLRGLISKSFAPHRIVAKRPLIERIVADLLDGLATTAPGETVDLRMDFAYQVSAGTVCELFGVPPEARAEVLRGGAVAVDTTLTPAQAQANLLGWQQVMLDLVAAKRAALGEDMISDMIRVQQEQPDRLNDSEFVGSLFMALGAGSETVMNMLNKTVVALLTHPDQFELVRTDEASWDDVIEEILRVEPPIAQLPLRYATDDIELDGVTIPKGDPIVICLAATGRDPARYGATADAFDITRGHQEFLTFGHGVHYCLGANLARQEAMIALPALFTRFPDLALAVDPAELRPQGTFIMNGYERLPVILKPY